MSPDSWIDNLLSIFTIIVVCTPFVAGIYILSPLDRVAKRVNQKVQFTITDFLGLIFLIQVVFALVRFVMAYNEVQLTFPPFFNFGLLTLLVWHTSVRVFARAGITDRRDRLITVMFILPMAYIAPLAFAAMLFIEMRELRHVLDTPWYQDPIRNWKVYVQIPLVLLVLATGIVVAGWQSRNIAARSTGARHEF